MSASVIRWWSSERPERVLQHVLIDDPDALQPEDPSVLPAASDPTLLNFR
jgi:hypothetical protein